MGEDEGRHVRRTRYRGSHPRSFTEKYKERSPEKYPEDVARVLARGDTPAGSHRSICVSEILELLAPMPGETAVDATLGYGGHAGEILKRILPGGRLLGFDLDAVELAKTARRLGAEGAGAAAFIPVHANFSELLPVLAGAGLAGIDLFLADLGVSSMQIDDPGRGFSFKTRGPLDMRMDGGRGASAGDYLRGVSEGALRDAIKANADEPESAAIAREICLRRGRLTTTRELAEAVCSAFSGLDFKDNSMQRTLRRVFQAIRIEVNGEFSSLETLLAALPSCLKPGARVVILCFHSGEDRRVEASFRTGLEAGLYASVASDPIRASREERYGNPRSSSAKLRWAIRSASPIVRGTIVPRNLRETA
jgi:16S rRNA (cytosine1402-N4)-methyltransferase